MVQNLFVGGALFLALFAFWKKEPVLGIAFLAAGVGLFWLLDHETASTLFRRRR